VNDWLGQDVVRFSDWKPSAMPVAA